MKALRGEVVAALIGAIIGSIISFILLVAWDVYKDRYRKLIEEARADRLVAEELEVDAILLKEVRELLVGDTAVARNQQREIIQPPAQVLTDAWKTTVLAGSFAPSSKDLAKEIALTYHRLGVLNQRLQARESYRATNKALTGYHQLRAEINDTLVSSIDELLPRLEAQRVALKIGGGRRTDSKRRSPMISPKWFNIAGLVLNILGTVVILAGIFVSKKGAVAIGVSRYEGGTLEENLKLPAVADRLRQSRLAKWGLGLIIVGFIVQLLAEVLR
jgi:hypothetical protein